MGKANWAETQPAAHLPPFLSPRAQPSTSPARVFLLSLADDRTPLVRSNDRVHAIGFIPKSRARHGKGQPAILLFNSCVEG